MLIPHALHLNERIIAAAGLFARAVRKFSEAQRSNFSVRCKAKSAWTTPADRVAFAKGMGKQATARRNHICLPLTIVGQYELGKRTAWREKHKKGQISQQQEFLPAQGVDMQEFLPAQGVDIQVRKKNTGASCGKLHDVALTPLCHLS